MIPLFSQRTDIDPLGLSFLSSSHGSPIRWKEFNAFELHPVLQQEYLLEVLGRAESRCKASE
jgi:hypothetical protein